MKSETNDYVYMGDEHMLGALNPTSENFVICLKKKEIGLALWHSGW